MEEIIDITTGKNRAEQHLQREKKDERKDTENPAHTGEDVFRYWFAGLILPRSQKHLILKDFTPARFFRMTEAELKDLTKEPDESPDSQITFLREPLFTKEQIRMIQASKDLELAEASCRAAKEKGIACNLITDPGFPERLREIPDPPAAIFSLGELPDENQRMISIVGARMCSEFGRRFTMKLARKAAEAGVGVVSGMALGIDSAAHAGALQAGKKTYAVLGGGCDICYPASSADLYRNIRESGGVLSEYPPGTKPQPFMFPERNRIISGLSEILVVVEAREKSGSLITVDCALEQGKDVYAVPGRIDDVLSQGCNRLIDQGAGILYDIDKFLVSIGATSEKKGKQSENKKPRLENREMLVYSCLDLHSKSLQEIMKETGLPFQELVTVLQRLKLRHLIREDFRNYYSLADSESAERPGK